MSFSVPFHRFLPNPSRPAPSLPPNPVPSCFVPPRLISSCPAPPRPFPFSLLSIRHVPFLPVFSRPVKSRHAPSVLLYYIPFRSLPSLPVSFRPVPSHSVLSCTVRFHPISSRADSSQTSITCRPHAAATPPRIHNHTITSSLLPTPPGRQHPRGTDTTGCRLIWDVKTLRTNDPGPSTPPFDLTILPPPTYHPSLLFFTCKTGQKEQYGFSTPGLSQAAPEH